MPKYGNEYTCKACGHKVYCQMDLAIHAVFACKGKGMDIKGIDKKVKYENLMVGNVFSHQELVFIKTYVVCDIIYHCDNFNAVCLGNGDHAHFEEHTEVVHYPYAVLHLKGNQK